MIISYDPLGLLGLGFIVGFCVTVVIFLMAKFQGKKVPNIKKSLLIMTALLVIIFIPPTIGISKIWLICSLLLTALIINYLMEALINIGINFYNFDVTKIKKTSQFIYIIALLIAIGILATRSEQAALVTFNFTKQVIIFLLGLLLALKLLWNKNKNQME